MWLRQKPNVFTRPTFRGTGLALTLLCEALRYLKAYELEIAQLEVKAEKKNALEIYTELAYFPVTESRV